MGLVSPGRFTVVNSFSEGVGERARRLRVRARQGEAVISLRSMSHAGIGGRVQAVSATDEPAGPRARGARQVTVLEVVVLEGRGVAGDVMREVTYYYSLEGELLASADRFAGFSTGERGELT